MPRNADELPMRSSPRQWLVSIILAAGIGLTVGVAPAAAVTSVFDTPSGTVTVTFAAGDYAGFSPYVTSDSHLALCSACDAALASVDLEAVRSLVVNAPGKADITLVEMQHFRNAWGRIPLTINTPADISLGILPETATDFGITVAGNALQWTDSNGASTVTFAVAGLRGFYVTGTNGNDVIDFRQMTIPVTQGYAYNSTRGGPAMSANLLDGDDVFYGPPSTRGSHITLGKGNDSIHLYGGPDYVMAGAGDDRIWSGDGDDIVFGDAGNDVIVTGKGNDSVGDVNGATSTVNLGPGNDRATTWVPNVTVYGGPGNDVLSAIGHVVKHAWLWGGAGRDELDVPRRIDAHLSCGRGRDTVQHNARHMTSCEHTIRP